MTELASPDDARWMAEAIREAELAYGEEEVPVGAVVVAGGRLIARGRNQIERLQDATAHAEILAIGAAAQAVGSWRLLDTTLYVTLEPCPMCAGALLLSRVSRVVFGAYDADMGAAGSLIDLFAEPRMRHRAVVTGGVEEARCRDLLRSFFAERRAKPAGERPE